MDSLRRTAIIVGILFIIASASPLIAFIGFLSIYDAAYLTLVAANEIPMIIGMILMLVLAASAAGIPIAIYPVLKKKSETLALSYFAARLFESIFAIFSVINLAAILSLSQAYVSAGSPADPFYSTSGSLALAAFSWSGILLDFPFVLSALILNYMLYKSELVPIWLSLWGFIGGLVYFGFIFSELFLHLPLEIFAAPLGLQEMALAVWLIAKGFTSEKTEE